MLSCTRPHDTDMHWGVGAARRPPGAHAPFKHRCTVLAPETGGWPAPRPLTPSRRHTFVRGRHSLASTTVPSAQEHSVTYSSESGNIDPRSPTVTCHVPLQRAVGDPLGHAPSGEQPRRPSGAWPSLWGPSSHPPCESPFLRSCGVDTSFLSSSLSGDSQGAGPPSWRAGLPLPDHPWQLRQTAAPPADQWCPHTAGVFVAVPDLQVSVSPSGWVSCVDGWHQTG